MTTVFNRIAAATVPVGMRPRMNCATASFIDGGSTQVFSHISSNLLRDLLRLGRGGSRTLLPLKSDSLLEVAAVAALAVPIAASAAVASSSSSSVVTNTAVSAGGNGTCSGEVIVLGLWYTLPKFLSSAAAMAIVVGPKVAAFFGAFAAAEAAVVQRA
eukprot:CAMPEP_0172771180 /NCGR_PEP_ID=MMETSP1074-20121228/190137_1 /TAXON_ID=2916 /ORGANISM="Ceratium fusus, Strain PA161109" /LENGTH=157 /DNA_ID=CAMNT_0013607077 /DNA_START=23 /DNA_END=497 /DNA_ORIENTATION=-